MRLSLIRVADDYYYFIMSSHFSENLKVKVDKDAKEVTLSIRVNENCVQVYKVSVRDFMKVVGEFQQQMR